MAAATVNLLVLLGPALLAVERALCLADEVKPLLALGDEGPVRVVLADRRVDLEPARQLHEKLHVFIRIQIGRKAALDLRLELDRIEERLLMVLHLVEVLEIAADAL